MTRNSARRSALLWLLLLLTLLPLTATAQTDAPAEGWWEGAVEHVVTWVPGWTAWTVGGSSPDPVEHPGGEAVPAPGDPLLQAGTEDPADPPAGESYPDLDPNG